MGTAMAIKLALDLATMLLISVPEARAEIEGITTKLRGFINEKRDPTDAEWNDLNIRVGNLVDFAERRGEEARLHLARLRSGET